MNVPPLNSPTVRSHPSVPARLFLSTSAALLGVVLVAPAAFAQTKPADTPAIPVTSSVKATGETEPTIELSPFVVGASADVGYEATESLAGTGLKTKLTDIGGTAAWFGSNDVDQEIRTWIAQKILLTSKKF